MGPFWLVRVGLSYTGHLVFLNFFQKNLLPYLKLAIFFTIFIYRPNPGFAYHWGLIPIQAKLAANLY